MKKITAIIYKAIEYHFTPYLVFILIISILLFPIVWMFITALKPLSETFIYPPTIIPEKLTFSAFEEVLFKSPIPQNILNSLIITITNVIITTFFAFFVACGISKYRYKGSKNVLFLFLFSRIIPPLALLIPYYILLTSLKLINTLNGLIVINFYICFPLAVWILKSFIDDFPQDLIDAARIDGCSRIGIIFRIMIPLLATSIAATAIIVFLWTWNEFIFAAMFTHTREVQPLTVGIYYFVGDEYVDWPRLSATAIIATIPGIIFLIMAQKYIIKGLIAGAIKK